MIKPNLWFQSRNVDICNIKILNPANNLIYFKGFYGLQKDLCRIVPNQRCFLIDCNIAGLLNLHLWSSVIYFVALHFILIGGFTLQF